MLDRVIDGTLLAATDTSSPVDVPMSILAADDALGAAFPSAHEARLRATAPDVEVVRWRARATAIHDERAHRDEYLSHVVSFISANASAPEVTGYA